MLTRISLRTVGFALVAMGFLAVAPRAAAQTPTKVYPYPGDQSWFPMTSGWASLTTLDGFAQITGDQPYGGNGSLRLSINGGAWPVGGQPEPGFFDWGFYGTLAQGTSWGRLDDITALSMVWRREGPDVGLPAGNPWAAQTPVLRLLLGDVNGLLVGELVWEKFYTDNSYLTPYGTWSVAPEDMIGQNFWHNSGSGQWTTGLNGAYINGYSGGAQYLVNAGCQDWAYSNAPTTLWPGGLVTGTVGQWSDLQNGLCDPHLSTTYVWGMAVGVGSRWPDDYLGYVDYVRLDFNNENAVYANFELPETTVPEPGTIVLLATGLLGLGGAKLLRRRR